MQQVHDLGLTYLEPPALLDLYDTVRRIERQRLQGVLLEAGCALGGSAIVIASAKAPWREFYIYDVFGMIPPPSKADGHDVHERYAIIASGQSEGISGGKYYGYEADLFSRVKANFNHFDLPLDVNYTHLVRGLFQNTLKLDQPVAFAHIDGDWYESVRTWLERIAPKLVRNGVLVIDDYDSWSGCRKAVDEYFADKALEYSFVKRGRLHRARPITTSRCP